MIYSYNAKGDDQGNMFYLHGRYILLPKEILLDKFKIVLS